MVNNIVYWTNAAKPISMKMIIYFLPHSNIPISEKSELM